MRGRALKAQVADQAVAHHCPRAHDARCIRPEVSQVALAVLVAPADDRASVALVDLAPALGLALGLADLVQERLDSCLLDRRTLLRDVRLDALRSVAEVAVSATRRAKKAR